MEWLEAFLRQQNIPMVIVSHDREFLDQVCTKIVDAEGGICTEYEGNYSRFLQLKKARMDAWQAAYDALQSVAVLEEVASRDYDAVVIPGGHGPLFDLAVDPTLAQVLVRAKAKNRLIAAVCHGQAGLVSAKNEEGTSIFADYRVTGFSNREEEIAGLDKLVPFALETRLVELGTRYEAKEPWHPHVVVDRNLITGQNPQSSELFAKTIVEALS